MFMIMMDGAEGVMYYNLERLILFGWKGKLREVFYIKVRSKQGLYLQKVRQRKVALFVEAKESGREQFQGRGGGGGGRVRVYHWPVG